MVVVDNGYDRGTSVITTREILVKGYFGKVMQSFDAIQAINEETPRLVHYVEVQLMGRVDGQPMHPFWEDQDPWLFTQEELIHAD